MQKMPGDEWQRFANARAFLAYMYAHPGKKLLFMGSEIGQYEEWQYNSSLRWELLDFDYHRKLQVLVSELNKFYRAHAPLFEVDFHWSGFEWVDFHDVDHSIIAFIRRAQHADDFLLVCCNFTPTPHEAYRFGVPEPGFYEEVFNTDASMFGGSNMGNGAGVASEAIAAHSREHSIKAVLPPLAVVVFRKRA
jgi:1,4-alpha-glucan branching enzyme